MEDDFETAKKHLKETKPWFPVTEMQNRSIKKEWILYVEPEAKLSKAKKEIKRKKKPGSFY